MANIFFKKITGNLLICVAGIIIVAIASHMSQAQGTKNKDGLNFTVPEDWPIEKRAGIVAPIPTEEYVVIKFKETDEEFQTIKTEMTSQFEELQKSIKNMKVQFDKNIKEAQMQSESQKEEEVDLTGILESIALLEKEIGRLDRKITSKVSGVQTKSDSTATEVKAIEKKIQRLQTQIYKLDEEIDYVIEKQGGAY